MSQLITRIFQSYAHDIKIAEAVSVLHVLMSLTAAFVSSGDEIWVNVRVMFDLLHAQ